MRRSLRFSVSYIYCAVVSLAFCTCPPVDAQTTVPKYDLTAEMKIKGTIEDLKLPEKGHDKEIVHLIMKNGDQTVDIYLCPKAFMDDMGITFNKGDEIAFTGSKVTQNGSDLMLARQIVKGPDTLVFRDDKGKPVW